MRAARLAADYSPGIGTAVLVGEGALEHVDDLYTVVLVQAWQPESSVPLDDSHLEFLIQPQDLATAGRCLSLLLDVGLGEVAHPRGGHGVSFQLMLLPPLTLRI